MTFLPIVDRELRVVSRLTATYRNRSLTVAVVAFVAMIMLAFGIFSSSPSQMGNSMFVILSRLTLIFCLLEGPRKTADCLSEEKREGTLGLLFLTDLKGYDVILGKLVAVSLNSFYGLLSILPVLALVLLLGGVLPGEFWRIALALANALFLSLSIGMLVSCWCRQKNSAVSGSFALIAALALVPLAMPGTFVAKFGPIYPFYSARATVFARAPQDYWMSLLITQILSWAVLAWASWIAPNCWREEKTVAYARPLWNRSPRRAAIDRAERQKMLATNPVFWLAMRSFGNRLPLFILMGAAVTMFVLATLNAWLGSGANALPYLVFAFWGINFFIKIHLARLSCRCFAAPKQNNSMEMLLSTPLTVDQIIKGQLLALSHYFVTPVLITFAIEILSFLALGFATWANDRFQGDAFGVAAALMGFSPIYIGYYILDAFGILWAGLWFGLSAKSESQAVNKTALFAIALPIFSFVMCYFGLAMLIFVPLFWIVFGSSKVRTEFRRLAAQQYTPPQTGWLPAGITGSNPPAAKQLP